MRKLSMKKPGTPEIEDSRSSGREGVSVEGEGAAWPARTVPEEELPAAPVSPVAPVWLLAPPLLDFPEAEVEPETRPAVLPCECAPWTWGVAATAGAPEAGGAGAGGTGAGDGAGAASPVDAAGGTETSGGGVETVVSAGGVVVVPVPGSSARLTAGAASASTANAQSSKRMSKSLLVIACTQFPRR
jgi:hypothetical protein